jgi:phage tail-like protein
MSEMIYPPVAFSFKVVVEGSLPSDNSFLEMSGIEHSMDTESYAELGENSFTHKLPKMVSSKGNLVVKRGIAPDSSPLMEWCRDVLVNFKLPIKTKEIRVHLMGPAVDNTLRLWVFENAYPVKWSVGGFKAMGNEVAIETIEFAYSHCRRERCT